MHEFFRDLTNFLVFFNRFLSLNKLNLLFGLIFNFKKIKLFTTLFWFHKNENEILGPLQVGGPGASCTLCAPLRYATALELKRGTRYK